MALMDIIISVGLALAGGLFGMDKSHNATDWFGPLLMAAGGGYAWWVGAENLALGIGGLLVLKLLVR